MVSRRKKAKFKQFSKRAITMFFKFTLKTLILLIIISTIVLNLVYYWLGDFKSYVFRYPELTGLENEIRNYLIIFQNDYELRSTGGFVTAYGILTFKDGKYIDLEINDSYKLDTPSKTITPPYPMAKFLKGNTNSFPLYFRDANFNANFPQSATDLISIYHENNPNIRIDGVIAVNFSFIEGLIDVFDGLDIVDKKITKSNIFAELEHSVNNVDKHNIDALESRKNILPELFDGILEKAKNNPKLIIPLKQYAINELNKKNIQMYFLNDELNFITNTKKWDGAWQITPSGDFLAIVEQNLGGLKSNRYITRNIEYNVKFDNDFNLIANVKIDIHHKGKKNIPISGDYKGFNEVYTPLGAQLIIEDGEQENIDNKKQILQYSKNGYNVFAQELFIKPGYSQSISYKYKLPKAVFKNQIYTLNIPKQSGTHDYYEITINSPDGYLSSSSEFEASEQISTFNNILDSDFSGKIKFHHENYSPYPIYQDIPELNSVVLVFNEPIDKTSALNVNNYAITDSNMTNNAKTDVITIKSISIEDTTVRLMIDGMTKQNEEHYKITMKNLRDLQGNLINPAIYTVTVVQRIQN